MIPDWKKNQVYCSSLLPEQFPTEFDKIKAILKKHSIQFKLLENTKDIWCRDYMPVQLKENNLLQFRYEPSYLKNDLHLQTNPNKVLLPTGFKLLKSMLNIDGGNITCSSTKAILTRRIFKENPTLSSSDILSELKNLLEVEIFLVDDINTDMTGHIDGQIRFVSDESILVNEVALEYKYWQRSFYKMISKSKLTYHEMPWFIPSFKTKKNSSIGSYVNYLQIDNLIIFPIFECQGNKDRESLQVIKRVFPNSTIETININAIADEGGLMNCITWSIS